MRTHLFLFLVVIAALTLLLPVVRAQEKLGERVDETAGDLSAKQGKKMQIKTTDKNYTATEAENLRRVKDGFDAWRKGTGSPYGMLAPNAKWTIVGNSLASKTYQSKQEFMDEVINPFNARLSKPLVPTVRAIYADGDMVIALFDPEGTAKDGKPYKNTYSWFMKIREGQIVEATAFFDSVHFNDFWVRVAPIA